MLRRNEGLSRFNQCMKRSIDLLLAILGLLVIGWVILLAGLISSIDTRKGGFLLQTRIGQWGKPFKIIKIRTMSKSALLGTTVTTANDPRITRIGKFFRKTKIDELPQLINVLVGQMSFVGPRPDVPGFADVLEGEGRLVLSIRPGITGPASIYFKNEEATLASVEDPEKYNYEVLFPKKVEINLEYIRHYSLFSDLRYIIGTVIPPIAPPRKINE